MKIQKKNLFFLLLVAVCIAGWILRLTVGLQLAAHDLFVHAPPSSTDMGTYQSLSEAILKGSFPDEFYYQPFYYAVFLPAIQLLTGPSDFMIVLIQSLCGACSILLAGLIAARIGGRKAGLTAAFLLAFSQIAILYTPYRLLEIMQMFWFTLLLYLTLRAMEKGALWRWFVTGLALSCAILSRGNAWCFLPAVLLACYWGEFRFRDGTKRGFSLAIFVLFLGILLPQIPFSAVNSIKYGTFRGPSTAGGAVLSLGNTKESPPGGLEYPLSYEIWTRNEAVRSVPMRIFDWIREEPLAYLELTFRKCFLFWNEYDIPNNINPAGNSLKSPLLAAISFLPTGLLLLFCVAGILISLRGWNGKRKRTVFLLFLLLYWLAAAAFYNLGRFRIPAFGFFCIAGGLWFASFFLRGKRKEYRKLLLFNGGALLAAYFIVYPGYSVYRDFLESGIIRQVRPAGIQVENPGKGAFVYDHGPMSFGGWNPVEGSLFQKRFALSKDTRGNVLFSIALIRTADTPRALIRINHGPWYDLDGMRIGQMAFLTFPVVYPENGLFQIELSGPVSTAADLQREYGRTFSGDGTPLPYELLVRIQFEKKP